MHPRMKIKELAMESNVMLYRVAFRISDVPWKIRWKITRFYITFKRRWKEAGTIRSGSFSFTHFLFLRETIGIDMYCDFLINVHIFFTSLLDILFYFIFTSIFFLFFLFIAHVSLKLFRERENFLPNLIFFFD